MKEHMQKLANPIITLLDKLQQAFKYGWDLRKKCYAPIYGVVTCKAEIMF